MTRNQPLAIVFGLIVLFLLGSSFLLSSLGSYESGGTLRTR